MRTTTFGILLILLSFITTFSIRPQPISHAVGDQGDLSINGLSSQGPQFPASFDANKLAMFYIVRGNWPIAIRYELAKGSARFQLKPMQRGNLIVAELPATSDGRQGKVLINTPTDYGDVPQVAELRITSNDSDFILHSLGCGGGAFVNGGERGVRPNRNPEKLLNHFRITNQQVSSDEVAIRGIALTPSDILDTGKGAKLGLRFQSSNDFTKWSVAFERQVQGQGSRWQIEQFIPFPNDPIHEGQTKTSMWDGKNAKGKVVVGRYKVMVSAWTSAARDGSAVTSFSSPAFIVK